MQNCYPSIIQDLDFPSKSKAFQRLTKKPNFQNIPLILVFCMGAMSIRFCTFPLLYIFHYCTHFGKALTHILRQEQQVYLCMLNVNAYGLSQVYEKVGKGMNSNGIVLLFVKNQRCKDGQNIHCTMNSAPPPLRRIDCNVILVKSFLEKKGLQINYQHLP